MSKTYQLENGITYTEGDDFFKGVPLQDGDNIVKTTGERVLNQFSMVLVPVEGNRIVPMDHRMFNQMYIDLMEQLESSVS